MVGGHGGGEETEDRFLSELVWQGKPEMGQYDIATLYAASDFARPV